jgi:hypothetical protein
MSRQYDNWVASQLEPEQTITHQGGMPRPKGINLWDDFKRMQDRDQQMLEDEMRRWEERGEERGKEE